MMIKHDAQGFLVGELVDTTKRLLEGQTRGLDALARIDRNLAVLVGGGRRGGSTPSARSGGSPGVLRALEPVGRSSGASGVGAVKSVAQAVAGETARAVARTQAARSTSISQIRLRDSGGRFVKGGGGSKGGGNSPAEDSGGGRGGGIISTAASNIRETAVNAASGIDPAVNALGELKQTLEPLGRGFRFAFGRASEQKKERWYKRFLKALERKPGTAGGGTTVFNNSSGGGVGGLLGGLAGPAMGLLGKGKGLLSVFKRVPVLGALLAGGGALTSLLGGGTTEEKYKGVGQSIGAGAGMFAGAALGSLLGPAGTIAGGYLGTMLGEKVGEALGGWAKGLVDADVPGRVISMAGAAWNRVAGLASTAAGAAVAVAGQAHEAIKQATGVDLGASASAAAAATKKAAGQAAGFVADNAGRLVPETVKRMAGWALGKTSEQFESGGRGAGTVSRGKGDRGGASYGTYQLSSKTGTLQQFLAESGYGAQFQGLVPGTPAFNAKWKALAESDPAFGQAQHDFIQRTHFAPQMALLKKSGLDMSGRGAAVNDAVWSTSVQFGGGTGLIREALKGRDPSKMSDAEIVAAIQDYKAANNGVLFKSSSAAVRAGTLSRARAEKVALLSLAGMSAQPGIPSTVAKIPAPMDVPMSGGTSGGGAGKATVVVAGEVGQNVSDRGIAHKVTGGMGAS